MSCKAPQGAAGNSPAFQRWDLIAAIWIKAPAGATETSVNRARSAVESLSLLPGLWMCLGASYQR
jgi:hypothetical protein